MPITLRELTSKLTIRLKDPLPGAMAHEPMRAVSSGTLRPKFEHTLPPRPGGVLILLYEEDGVIKFPLTKRREYPGAHSGQISLPGGKTEPGEDAIKTALRESEEEIGIRREDVTVLGTLTDFFVIPSNFMVTPVVGYMQVVPQFVPQTTEVARIIEGRVDMLLPDDAIRTKEIIAANTYHMLAPHFEVEGEVVWGATAMMLNEFRLIVRELMHN